MNNNDKRTYLGRRYGTEMGKRGSPENFRKCIVRVYGAGEIISRQCSRPRGHGSFNRYCKQHAVWTEEERND